MTLPEFVNQLGDIWVDSQLETYNPTLQSEQDKRTQLRLEFDAAAEGQMQRLQRGLAALLSTLRELGTDASTWEVFDRMKETQGSPDGNPRELYNISDEQLQLFYSAADHHYRLQHYQEAADILTVLCAFDQQNGTFWLALGNALFYTRDYEHALQAYIMSALIDPEDPHSTLYAAHCYDLLGDKANAASFAQAAAQIREAQKIMKNN